MTTTTTFPFLGTISHGTLREEDLVPTFREVLDHLDPRAALELDIEYLDIYAMLDVLGTHQMSPRSIERLWWLTEDLFGALDDLAPEGYYFGAIEGDGSDFGFWQSDDDEQDWDEHDPFRDDVEADADTLRMAGYGTDEDYGLYDSGEWE